MEKKVTKHMLNAMDNFADKCGSCKFLDTKTDQCREKKIAVTSQTPSCEKWRYFA